MSKGLDMLRDYIEHDALCMRRRKCCEIEDVLMQEMDALKAENNKLRELVQDYDKCLDTALYLAGNAGYPCMPNSGLFRSLHPRMRELGIARTVA